MHHQRGDNLFFQFHHDYSIQQFKGVRNMYSVLLKSVQVQRIKLVLCRTTCIKNQFSFISSQSSVHKKRKKQTICLFAEVHNYDEIVT